LQAGLRKAADHEPDSLGVDTWGVDFALLDAAGELIGNPCHYRDPYTDGMLAEAMRRTSRERIFDATGIQFMQINSLYQLLAMATARSPALGIARTLLMMPDLFHYWFTGEMACEFSNASTTQFFDPRAGDWARSLLDDLGIPHHFLTRIVQPGADLGPLSPSVLKSLELASLARMRVIAPATHDTGSAVASVPANGDRYAYISSGTWSLLGAVVSQPVITPRALQFNFTNEGGVGGTFRLLKNIMGMWLVQECRRRWATPAGELIPYADLFDQAARAPAFAAMLDPDDPSFLLPEDMPTAIAAFCARTRQATPAGRGTVVRCILESLALKYRHVLEQLERLTGHRVEVIHVVGGGSRNALLCQFTADACDRIVRAGPVEATAIGNVLVQMVACGELGSMDEARAVVQQSFPIVAYQPREAVRWSEAYDRFQRVLASMTPV
jgi:rhamnulokinase